MALHVYAGRRVGIILDTAGGKNNGTVGGHKYFQCADQHGCLSVPSKVERETAETAPTADTQDGVYDDTEGFQGVVALPTPAPKKDKKTKKVKQADFTYTKVLGRGSFGKVCSVFLFPSTYAYPRESNCDSRGRGIEHLQR